MLKCLVCEEFMTQEMTQSFSSNLVATENEPSLTVKVDLKMMACQHHQNNQVVNPNDLGNFASAISNVSMLLAYASFPSNRANIKSQLIGLKDNYPNITINVTN